MDKHERDTLRYCLKRSGREPFRVRKDDLLYLLDAADEVDELKNEPVTAYMTGFHCRDDEVAKLKAKIEWFKAENECLNEQRAELLCRKCKNSGHPLDIFADPEYGEMDTGSYCDCKWGQIMAELDTANKAVAACNATENLHKFLSEKDPDCDDKLGACEAEVKRLRAALEKISKAKGHADKIVCLLEIQGCAELAQRTLEGKEDG
uniref:Uncharacterized protein n=1 Tax=viral metagenome TaxID=1070528 RepID=A0A6M3XGV1_9ZZZZ